MTIHVGCYAYGFTGYNDLTVRIPDIEPILHLVHTICPWAFVWDRRIGGWVI